jgi:hypothetical protein
MAQQLAAETIVFAINAAIRLGKNFQRAYANSINGKSIVLPLPRFDGNPTIISADRFFQTPGEEGGQDFLAQIDQLQSLFNKSLNNTLDDQDRATYLDYYRTLFALVQKSGDDTQRLDAGITNSDVVTLLKLRQWQKGETPFPSALQLVAGTIVELGIDYFNQVPGALNANSSYGKALKHFLSGFDNISFAENEHLQQTLAKEVIPQLFIGAAESLSELSAEITGDEQFQRFIKATAEGVARDVLQRTSAPDARNADVTIHWGQMVVQSLIKNAGNYAFSSSASLFGTNEAVSALINKTGIALMSIILDEGSTNINLKQVLTVESLDKIVRAALTVVSEYPELLSKNQGVKEIIAGVSEAVAESGIQRPDLLPEIIRLVLEFTASNLYRLWDVEDTSAKHLLLTAVEHTLRALAQPPKTGAWRPQLSKSQITELIEDLLDEVVKNPALVTNKVNQDSLLYEVLTATFTALEQVPKEQRLGWEVVELLIQLNLRTVLRSKAVLSQIQWGSEEQTTTILNKILDLIFSVVFDEADGAGVEKAKLFQDLFEYCMDVVVSEYPNRLGLVIIQVLVSKQTGIDFTEGFNRQIADEIVEAALILLTQHPQLVSDDEALQRIIGGVAEALLTSGIHQPGLLPEIVRLVLIKTADNIELLFEADRDKMEYLPVAAAREILHALGAEPPEGRWKPRFTPEQLVSLFEFLLDEVVQNPAWVTDKVQQDSLLREVLDLTLRALQKVPAGQRLTAQTFEYVLEIVLRGVARSKKLLERITWASDTVESSILERVLDLALGSVFPPSEGGAVDKPKLLIDLLEYIFDVILAENPDAKGLALVELILSDAAGIDFSKGFYSDVVEELVEAALMAIASHPELINGTPSLRDILGDSAPAIHLLGLDHPNIGPEILSILLEQSAGHLDTLLEVQPGHFRHLLVEALQQMVLAFAAERTNGRWTPRFTEEQVMDIVEFLLEGVVENPDWIKDDFIFRVIDAILIAFDQKVNQWRTPYILVTLLIIDMMEVAAEDKGFLAKLKTDKSENASVTATYVALQLVNFLIRQDRNTLRTLTNPPIVDTMLEFYLDTVNQWDLSAASIDKSIGQLQDIVDKFALGEISGEDLLDLLSPES